MIVGCRVLYESRNHHVCIVTQCRDRLSIDGISRFNIAEEQQACLRMTISQLLKGELPFVQSFVTSEATNESHDWSVCRQPQFLSQAAQLIAALRSDRQTPQAVELVQDCVDTCRIASGRRAG